MTLRAMRAVILSIFVALPVAGQADQLVGSVGYEGRNGVTGVVGTIELHRTLGRLGRLEYGVGAGAVLAEGGGHWVGAGGVARFDLGADFFVEGTFMPGLQAEGERDLGGPIEFRSLIGVGREIAPGQSVSLAFSHRSNGPVYEKNPGVEAVTLRYGRKF